LNFDEIILKLAMAFFEGIAIAMVEKNNEV